jgi:hypothetical protein
MGLRLLRLGVAKTARDQPLPERSEWRGKREPYYFFA